PEDHLSQLSRVEQLFGHLIGWGEMANVSGQEFDVCGFHCLEDLITFCECRRHWLLQEDVLTSCSRLQSHLRMEMMWGGDDHRVYFRVIQQFPVISIAGDTILLCECPQGKPIG